MNTEPRPALAAVFRMLAAVALLCGLLACASSGTGAPSATDGDSMAADLSNGQGASGLLFWTPEQQKWGYKNISRIRPTRRIEAGSAPYPLPTAKRDLSAVSYELDGERHTLAEYLEERRVAGMLVIQNGKIVMEHYALGNDENSRWISFSVAKSVVSMLVGAAIEDGYIESVDERVTAYLPRLAGSAYDQASIRDILQMASGVAWNEDYTDPASHRRRAPSGTLPLFEYMGRLPVESAPGETFNYNTGETNLVGAVLRSAIGNNLATYLTHEIWQPFGMESDADWLLEAPGGVEWGGCCIMATLRDYGRIGLFAMGDGVLRDGTRVLPNAWMEESTSPSKGSEGYGYLWWLRDEGRYAALGIFGQLISIDPKNDIVIVTHSAWPEAGNRELYGHRGALIEAITTALTGDGP